MANDDKIGELKGLEQKAIELRTSLRKLRFDLSLGQLDDTSKIRKEKKELARVLTKISTLDTGDSK